MRYAILGVALSLLGFTEDANAQYGRGRGGNNWNGYSNRGYYGNYNRGYWGNNWGWRGNRAWPRYYPNTFGFSYYTTPNVYYYNSSPNVIYSQPRTSAYFDSDFPAPVASDRQARVQVRVNNYSDEVLVQGQLMPGTGLTREFVSPELAPGKDFVYSITVRRSGSTSQTNDTRSVEVRGGGTFTIDFTRPASIAPLPR